MEACAPRHEERPPASDLPLPTGGRGLHPPAPLAAGSMPAAQGLGRSRFQMKPRVCWTSLPQPTVWIFRVGGVSFTCNPVKKMPYTFTWLFRSQVEGSDAVLVPLLWPGHLGFIAKGCKIVVARFVPPADTAVAVSGVGEPLHTSPDPLAHAARWKS